jgi:hypothetical protein
MKQRFAKRLMLLALLSSNTVMAEPVNNAPGWTVDLTLPIHQKTKLHPEFSDPVLGDQAQIVEWAWSPQYAERFGLQPQPDGLPNGGLWLVGVKIERQQYKQWQTYTCNIMGLIDNTLPIITPPGEHLNNYLSWQGVLPGMTKGIAGVVEYTPGQAANLKFPRNEAERTGGYGITTPYLAYIKHHKPDLAYFELAGQCSNFRDPEQFRNELRFPTQAIGKKDDAVFESSAVKFDLPDSLIRRIYPYTVDANDWTSCLMRRAGDKSNVLTLRASKSKRFGNSCEPVNKQPK